MSLAKVVIESPYQYQSNVAENVAYARKAMIHSLRLNEAPFASHLVYTQALSDTVINERRLGIDCGYVWGCEANYVAFYADLGWSSGMEHALNYYRELRIPCFERTIYSDDQRTL